LNKLTTSSNATVTTPRHPQAYSSPQQASVLSADPT